MESTEINLNYGDIEIDIDFDKDDPRVTVFFESSEDEVSLSYEKHLNYKEISQLSKCLNKIMEINHANSVN